MNNDSPIDISSSLKRLQETALSRPHSLSGERSPFVEGYLMALRHALELAEVQRMRINLRLEQGGQAQ